jgi:hypothetical protein
MAKLVMQRAREDYEAHIIEALDVYRSDIESRKSGYLRGIQSSLRDHSDIDCPYVYLSLLVKRYRLIHDIPMHNRRADRRARQAQNVDPTE